jgi:hypothetical protein
MLPNPTVRILSTMWLFLAIATARLQSRQNSGTLDLGSFSDGFCSTENTELGPVPIDGSCIPFGDNGNFGAVWVNNAGTTLTLQFFESTDCTGDDRSNAFLLDSTSATQCAAIANSPDDGQTLMLGNGIRSAMAFVPFDTNVPPA